MQPYYSITDWENEPSQKTAINRTNLLKMENGIKEGDNRLVQMDANKYNVPADHVIRHYDVTGKICPNPFVYNHTQHTWEAFKAALVTPSEYSLGWNHDDNGWWYASTKTTYYKSSWQIINGHKYYFNQDGYAINGWQEIEGKWYYFEPRAGHNLECALYVSDQDGAQGVWSF